MRAGNMLDRIREVRSIDVGRIGVGRVAWRAGVWRTGVRVRFFHGGASTVSPILRRESEAQLRRWLRKLVNLKLGGSHASGRNSYSLITAATSNRPLGTPLSTRTTRPLQCT